MNHKIKRKWIAALRGGNYAQCYGWYRTPSGHCAIGVLHEVDPESRLIGEACTGISQEDANRIVIMNDLDHKSFSEIADWIEDNIPDTSCANVIPD